MLKIIVVMRPSDVSAVKYPLAGGGADRTPPPESLIQDDPG